MLRLPTRLEPALEDLVYRTIGCCIAVHRELGPGLMEKAYARALASELGSNNIPFEREKRLAITYRSVVVYVHRLDLVVGKQIVMELKAVDHLHNVALLPQGIARIVL
jgi:GxxExxY protein